MTSTPTRPPWWRSALLGLLVAFGSMGSAVYSEPGQRAGTEGAAALLPMVFILVPVLLGVSMGWRHRRPLGLTLATAAVGALTVTGATAALVAFACLTARTRGWRVWAGGAAAAGVAAIQAIRDVRAPNQAASVLQTLMAGSRDPAEHVALPWWSVPLAAGFAVAAAYGAGCLARLLRRVRVADARTATLDDELARRAERERIAQEVHDGLGHRLSLLSLHAGALEATAGEDPTMARSAALVRENAARSMDELRDLLAVLNQDPAAAPPPTLAGLRQLLDEAVAASPALTATVYLDFAQQAPPELARAGYRVVQELLTNARKHAPGAPVRLAVAGGPGGALTIQASNPLGPPAAAAGGGRGLRGLVERVESLGGTIRYGVDGPTFRTDVSLPWPR